MVINHLLNGMILQVGDRELLRVDDGDDGGGVSVRSEHNMACPVR